MTARVSQRFQRPLQGLALEPPPMRAHQPLLKQEQRTVREQVLPLLKQG